MCDENIYRTSQVQLTQPCKNKYFVWVFCFRSGMDPSEVNTDEILKKMGGKGGEVATKKKQIQLQFMHLGFELYFLLIFFYFESKHLLLKILFFLKCSCFNCRNLHRDEG